MSSVYHRQGAPGFPSDTCSFLVYSLSRTKEASRHVKPRQIANINYFHLAASVYHPITWWNVRSCSIDVVLHCIDFLHFCFISGFIYLHANHQQFMAALLNMCCGGDLGWLLPRWTEDFQLSLVSFVDHIYLSPSSFLSLFLSLSLSLSSLFSSLFFLFSFSLRSKSQPPAWSKSQVCDRGAERATVSALSSELRDSESLATDY